MREGHLASAPGRVNLIGEHTDHNGGFVLPAPLPQRTAVAVTPRVDDLIRARSTGYDDAAYRLGEESRRGGWIDHIQGVTAALRTAGLTVTGCDIAVTSDLPAGAGLGSSAALAVAVLRALRQAFGLAIDDLALALLARSGEAELVGANVGVMDQLAASLGKEGHALFIDARSLEIDTVALPEELELVVIDSGVRHAHATGDYNVRRAECAEAARLLGVATLRDVDRVPLGLPPRLERRVRHVLSENARVLEMVDALRASDLASAGALLRASHASLRDDFEVSTPELDALVEIAGSYGEVCGARLVGGGFGGSIVAFTRRGAGSAVAAAICRDYGHRVRREAAVILPS